jgi:hypothetical protein
MKTRKTGDVDFDQFWLEYPRKEGVSKAKSLDAYRKARKTTSAAEILTGLRAYPFSADPQFQPHATTWLNQRRWHSESNTPAPTVVVPTVTSRSSWLAKYDGTGSSNGLTPAARRARLDASDAFTVDVDWAGNFDPL